MQYFATRLSIRAGAFGAAGRLCNRLQKSLSVAEWTCPPAAFRQPTHKNTGTHMPPAPWFARQQGSALFLGGAKIMHTQAAQVEAKGTSSEKNEGGGEGEDESWFDVAKEKWGDLGEGLLTALKDMGIESPTEIQQKALPEMMGGHSVVLLSETGSGKTLTYMLPMVRRIKKDEIVDGVVYRARPKRPRAIVLVPTRELGEQILAVSKKLTHHAHFSTGAVLGGVKKAPQCDMLEQGVDVIIGTPTRLNILFEQGKLYFGDVRQVVVDECDTMFAQGFEEDLEKCLRPIRLACQKAKSVHEKSEKLRKRIQEMLREGNTDPAVIVSLEKELKSPFISGDTGHLQMTLVAATLTKPVRDLLARECQDAKVIKSTGAHRSPATIRQTFVEVKPNEKPYVLMTQLNAAVERSKQGSIIVFCNTVSSCQYVHNFLAERGIPHASIHGNLPANFRAAQLKDFMDRKEDILLCTDIMSRGLDLRFVTTIINFDMPTTSVDYLHRIGRTGRAGAKGFAVSLVLPKDLAMAKGIELSMKAGKTLEAVSNRGSVLHTMRQNIAKEMRAKRPTLKNMSRFHKSRPGLARSRVARPVGRSTTWGSSSMKRTGAVGGRSGISPMSGATAGWVGRKGEIKRTDNLPGKYVSGGAAGRLRGGLGGFSKGEVREVLDRREDSDGEEESKWGGAPVKKKGGISKGEAKRTRLAGRWFSRAPPWDKDRYSRRPRPRRKKRA